MLNFYSGKSITEIRIKILQRMCSMEMDVKKIEGITIVKPRFARIDAPISTEFKGYLVDLINNGNNRIILNLNNVTFVDSSGLGVMIALFKTLKDKGQLALCEIKSPIMQLFTLTRTDRIFSIYHLESEALEAFNVVK